ncbi:porin [Azospirillum griseum]|uniref:Porin n=1 Tax=Azospirillum griseum TaxID=2496639 RepID=A0A3S0I290_9PROT|nr:porin [Azospirillum griseum]RTR22005.1 porin [Azospirillum griseum]
MKRSLLIGCAVSAIVCAAGAASAQTKSKFDILVGGDAYFLAAYAKEDVTTNANGRTTEFSNRFRLHFTPTAKADNGLEYGARLRLRAANANRTVDADRGFLFVNGAFGTVQAGVINGLGDEYGNIGPNVDGIGGTPDGNALNFYAGSLPYALGNLRTQESGDNATKLVYLTPTFSGLQLGAAYTPRTGDYYTSINRTKNTTNYFDTGEVGAFYKGAYGAVSVDASVEYIFGNAGVSTVQDLSSVHTGVTVGYGAFKIGGSYAYSGKSGHATTARNLDKNQVWILGAQYATGPLTFAATYTDAKGGVESFAATTNAKAHLWQAGVTYAVAPGLTTSLEYSFLDNKVGTVNNDANIVLIDTRIAF